MSNFSQGEIVKIISEETSMVVTSFDDKFPETANCLWIDDERNVHTETLPEAVLESLDKHQSRMAILRRQEPNFLAGDVVQATFADVRMTVAGVMMENGRARVTCYWLNSEKAVQKAVIPGICLTIGSD